MKTKILFVAFLFVANSIFAASLAQEAGGFDATVLLEAATPLIVLAATWVFGKVWPSVPAILQLTAVAGLSALLAWITSIMTDPGLGFWAQFAIGLGATFLHQFYKKTVEATSPAPIP